MAVGSRMTVLSKFVLLIDFEFFFLGINWEFYVSMILKLELIGLGFDWNCWA